MKFQMNLQIQRWGHRVLILIYSDYIFFSFVGKVNLSFSNETAIHTSVNYKFLLYKTCEESNAVFSFMGE